MRRPTLGEFGWQALRKTTQLSMLLFVVYAAVSLHWRNYKAAHNSSRIVELMSNSFNAWLYRVNETLLGWFGPDTLATSESLTGMPWSLRIAGIPFTDPWAVVALLAGGAAPPVAMALGALVPLALALVLGKIWCSFLCPARLMFEASSAVRRGLMWLGLPLPTWRLPRIGLWVGAAAILFAAGAGPAIFQWVLPYYALGAGVTVWFTTGAVTGILVWAGVMMVFDAFFAPGQACTALCPTGALLEQFGRAPALALVRSEGPCPPSCDLCQRACPYGLFPGRDTHRPACDTCGRCTMACPRTKLAPKAVRPGRFFGAFAVCLGLWLAGSAAAHHNKGLPHYGYFENYPQVPTEEFIDEVGRWEVGAVFFNFQGMNRTTSDTPDDVRIFAYAYDLETDRGYRGNLTVHVDDDTGTRVHTFDRLEPDQEGTYVFRATMPASGRYTLMYEFEQDGAVVTVPLQFDVDLEADRIPWMLIGGAATALALLFAVAIAGRKDKVGRRAAPAEMDVETVSGAPDGP